MRWGPRHPKPDTLALDEPRNLEPKRGIPKLARRTRRGRENEDDCFPDSYVLPAVVHGFPMEEFRRRSLAVERQRSGTEPPNLPLQTCGVERVPWQLTIAPRYGLGHVGQPDPTFENSRKLGRLETSRSQPNLMQCVPEAIPGARIVRTLSGGYRTGGGAAEDHPEAGRENVGKNMAHFPDGRPVKEIRAGPSSYESEQLGDERNADGNGPGPVYAFSSLATSALS